MKAFPKFLVTGPTSAPDLDFINAQRVLAFLELIKRLKTQALVFFTLVPIFTFVRSF